MRPVADGDVLRNAGSKNTRDDTKSTDKKWFEFETPMNTQWRHSIPEVKRILDEEGLAGLHAALSSEPRTRWISELLAQVKRVLSKGKSEIILVLGFCPLDDKMLDLDRPTCRTIKVASGLEMPDGPPVILLDLRKDCIRRHLVSDGKETDGCMPMGAEEEKAFLPHLAFEIYLITQIFELDVSSVIGFSDT